MYDIDREAVGDWLTKCFGTQDKESIINFLDGWKELFLVEEIFMTLPKELRQDPLLQLVNPKPLKVFLGKESLKFTRTFIFIDGHIDGAWCLYKKEKQKIHVTRGKTSIKLYMELT